MMGDRKIYWRCFHCGDAFTRAQERWAREHFGRNCDDQPVCLIRSAGETALLTALRKAQDELDQRRVEDTEIIRAMHSMAADHTVALRREEERGYAKGLEDGRTELTAVGTPISQLSGQPGCHGYESFVTIAESWGYP